VRCIFLRTTSGNETLTYGETSGFPKNCRAIITANIDGWQAKRYTAEDAFNAINRSCGQFGYSWEQKPTWDITQIPTRLGLWYRNP
jgi:hypothetical protein